MSNLVVFAMRRPVTMLMIIVALLGGGALAVLQMRTDIFPAINAPQIIVVNNYAGMDPSQIEGIITNVYEQNFQYVDGLRSVESKNIQNLVLLKLGFYPGTDMAAATAQVVSLTNRARGQMPSSVLPPFVIRFDAASVPIGYLVLDSKTRPLGELADLGLFRIRPMLVERVAGTVAFSPFGSNTRAIVVFVDPDRLRAHNLSPEDVVGALESGNVVIPSGNLYVQGRMPLMPTNAMVADPQRIGEIPIRTGKDVYIRDVATIKDTTDINYGCALVNGRRSIYIPVVKKDTASTLTVVAQIHETMSDFQAVLPQDVHVRYEFDESSAVRAAIHSVVTEGGIGAALTGLMILVFLRDWRTVIVVVVSIPLSLAVALVGLWATGNTINIMSLGGMALSIGILVDTATVTVENTHSQLMHTTSIARAVRRSDTVTSAARLLAMLCILSVFFPAFILTEPVRSLFMPLTLAVGFAMFASYALSSTVVPVLSVWLIKHHKTTKQTLLDKSLPVFERVVSASIRLRWVIVPAYLIVCVLLLVIVGRRVGTELFPEVDSGQFVLRFRAPPGAEYDVTRQMALKILEIINAETGGQVAMSMGYVGLGATNTATNNILLFMRGSDDGMLRVRLDEDSKIHVSELRERLRKALPQQAVPWARQLLLAKGHNPEAADALAKQISFGFEPGDIVSTVMSFGAPTPIEVMVAGPDRAAVEKHAFRLLAEMRRIPTLRDVQLYQQLDYPTIDVDIDRQRAGLCGVTIRDVTGALLVGTSSSRYIVKNYWCDKTSGVNYQVQVQAPIQRMNQSQQAETFPLRKVDFTSNLLIRDVASVHSGTAPGEVDREAMQRYLSVTANVEGADLGSAASLVRQAIADAGKPPRGVRVNVRGQVLPMDEMFRSLKIGLSLAVLVILILLTGYFQSFRLGLTSIGAVPGVVCGVVLLLWLTRTTLNIESFMGAIMCVGVAVSNSVLLSTFMADYWKTGGDAGKAAVDGARDRLRPVLMTAIAMLLGTLPMALALEKGSGMMAPLGIAVIGGLIVSTFATMLVVPSIFTLLIGHGKKKSPSLDPDDPSSPHYDPPKSNGPGGAAVAGLLLLALCGGCYGRQGDTPAEERGSRVRHVQVDAPQRRDLRYAIEQPGFVDAFERTAMFSKLSGFIERFVVDIGDAVKKDDLMALVFVPELHEEYQAKVEQVALDKRAVEQAQKMVAVAEGNLQTATARVSEAIANVGREEALVARWDSEVTRLIEMVRQRVVDKQILAETQRQLAASKAAREAAKATVAARKAEQAANEAAVAKALADVAVAEAKVRVSEADRRKAAALVSYTRITSPYDGIVTVRNANTGDYVQAVSGDKSTPTPSPIFVVARTDIVRVFVDVPERFARHVSVGTSSAVRAVALSGLPIPAAVTRTSWAVREQTRTLRTEIDLTQKEYAGLRPGMYAYVQVFIRRENVYTVPKEALWVSGNETYCFLLRGGKIVKTAVVPGLSAGAWTEISQLEIDGRWRPVSGKEEVVVGDLTDLSDGHEATAAPTSSHAS